MKALPTRPYSATEFCQGRKGSSLLRTNHAHYSIYKQANGFSLCIYSLTFLSSLQDWNKAACDLRLNLLLAPDDGEDTGADCQKGTT